jgi:hypothetical protein
MSNQVEESKVETSESTKTEWSEPQLNKIDMVEKTASTSGNSADAAGSQTIG